MSDVRQVLELDLRQLVYALILLAVVFVSVAKAFDFIVDRFGIELKGNRKKKEQEDLLQRTVGRVDELEKEIHRVDENSFNADKRIESKVDDISTKLDEMKVRNDEAERARIKDRIAQSYRYYHEKGSWTEMEKEAFNGLIESYEAHLGNNSFVHSICQPESLTWKIIDE